jgi:hypothetical protein
LNAVIFILFAGLNDFFCPKGVSAFSAGIAPGKTEISSVAPHQVGSFRGGPDRSGLRRSEIPFGGGAFPGATKVAQVLPDSGL